MNKPYQPDNVDLNILSCLMQDAKTSYMDIAKKLFISTGTVHFRLKKMEEAGIIRNSSLQINYEKLGYDITAFLGIYLNKSSQYHVVAKQLEQIPEVVDLHYTTGIYSMFAKIVCRDTKHLREVLNDKIQNIPDITRTETFISLEESIRRPIKLGTDDQNE